MWGSENRTFKSGSNFRLRRRYCVILKSHFPLLPIRPFRAFLFGFLHFLGVSMSIVSNISTAFYSDCNTFATPRRLYLRQSRVSEIENGRNYRPILLSSLHSEFLAKDLVGLSTASSATPGSKWEYVRSTSNNSSWSNWFLGIVTVPHKSSRKRGQAARDIQLERFSMVDASNIIANVDMRVREVRQFCKLQDEGQSLMLAAMSRLNLGGCADHRILKLALAILDLAGSDCVWVKFRKCVGGTKSVKTAYQVLTGGRHFPPVLC